MGPKRHQINILLVDDTPANLIALEAVLSLPGYNLIKARSGAEALAALEHHECAAILLDVQMPIMDGFETARRIRRSETSRNTPIIFVTAIYGDASFIKTGYDLGAIDYLFKPFDPDVLKAKVNILAELYMAKQELLEKRLKEKDQQSQIALEQSEARFRHLADALPQMVFTASPDGRIEYYNQRWYDFTGADMGEGWEPYLHPHDRPLVAERWKRSVNTGELFEFEARLRRASDQTSRWHLIRAIAVKNASGSVARWFGICTDIHEKREAEEVLKERSEQFRLITEAIPQLVWRCNPDGSADYFSQRFLNYVGYRSEEVLGWGWSEVIHPEDRPRVIQEWARCRALGIPVSVEFRVKEPSGKYRWFISLGNPFRDGSGNIIKYYGTWTDIDEQKRAHESIEQALHARDEFLSVASHELKTPLTSLKLQLQLAQRNIQPEQGILPTPERLMKLVSVSNEQVDRLDNLVEELLDISRIQAGRLRFSFEKVNLSQLVKECADRFHEQLTRAACPIELHLEKDAVAVCDRFRMEQVMVNLLSNAIKYGAGKKIIVSVELKGKEAELKVQDHGIGIEKSKLGLIFERFERAISSDNISGLGLGLYIVRQIVIGHQGSIEVVSQMGEGSSFIVRIPTESEQKEFSVDRQDLIRAI